MSNVHKNSERWEIGVIERLLLSFLSGFSGNVRNGYTLSGINHLTLRQAGNSRRVKGTMNYNGFRAAAFCPPPDERRSFQLARL